MWKPTGRDATCWPWAANLRPDERRRAAAFRLAGGHGARRSDPSSWGAKSSEAQKGFIADYVSFEIVVDKLLKGKSPRKVSVTWDNSTFREPDALSGRHLMA